MSSTYVQQKQNKPNKNWSFMIAIVITQGVAVGICSSLLPFRSDLPTEEFLFGDLWMLVGLGIFALLGFGLINLYSSNGSFRGLQFTLLVYSLSLIHFLLFSVMWKAIFWQQCRNNGSYLSIASFQERQSADTDSDGWIGICEVTYLEGIKCSISIIINLFMIINVLNLMDIFMISLIGTFFYTLHSEVLQIMSFYDVYDIGSGFSIFAFGSGMSTVLFYLLYDFSQYRKDKATSSSRAMGVFGVIFATIAFPFIYVAGIYRSESDFGVNPKVIFIVIFNITFGVISGVLGCVACSMIIYSKIHIHMFVICALSGGVALSFSSHNHKNLAIPLFIGFISGVFQSLLTYAQIKNNYKAYPSKILASINRYLVPSIIGGFIYIVSISLQDFKLLPPREVYNLNKVGYISGQLFISLFIGALAGFISGILIRIYKKIASQQRAQLYIHSIASQSSKEHSQ